MTVQTTVTFEDKPVEAVRASLRAVGIAIDLLPNEDQRERMEALRAQLRGIHGELVNAEQRAARSVQRG